MRKLQAVREWARSVYVVSVVASIAVLLLPKRYAKHGRFVAEMLILVCVLSPIAKLSNVSQQELFRSTFSGQEVSPSGEFYARQVEDGIRGIANSLGLTVGEVELEIKDGSGEFARVIICLERPAGEDAIKALKKTVAAWFGMDEASVTVTAVSR